MARSVRSRIDNLKQSDSIVGCHRTDEVGALARDVDQLVETILHREEHPTAGSIADRTVNGVIVADAAGQIEWVNNGFTEISGYTLDEVMGKKPALFTVSRNGF